MIFYKSSLFIGFLLPIKIQIKNNNIIDICLKLGDSSDENKVKYYPKALQIYKTHGIEDENVAKLYYTPGLKSPENQEENYMNALKIYKNSNIENENVANLCYTLGAMTHTLDYYKEALNIYKKIIKEACPSTLNGRCE